MDQQGQSDSSKNPRVPLYHIPPPPPSPLPGTLPIPPPPPDAEELARMFEKNGNQIGDVDDEFLKGVPCPAGTNGPILPPAEVDFEFPAIPVWSDPAFKPGVFFFYGSLMDPEVLQTITKHPFLPVLRRGYITDFQVKMWGIYPTLVPIDDSNHKVYGMCWEVPKARQVHALARYETDAYKMVPTVIHNDDGTVLTKGRTFCWAGDLNSTGSL